MSVADHISSLGIALARARRGMWWVRAAVGARVRGQRVRVEVLPTDGLRGRWEPDLGVIRIAPGQRWPEASIVLLHELLHAADDLSATERPRLPHADVARVAPVLLELLTGLGLWPDLAPEDLALADRRIRKDSKWRMDDQP